MMGLASPHLCRAFLFRRFTKKRTPAYGHPSIRKIKEILYCRHHLHHERFIEAREPPSTRCDAGDFHKALSSKSCQAPLFSKRHITNQIESNKRGIVVSPISLQLNHREESPSPATGAFPFKHLTLLE